MSKSAFQDGNRPSLLLIEPSRALRQVLVAHCRSRGVLVTLAADVPSARVSIMEQQPAAIIWPLARDRAGSA